MRRTAISSWAAALLGVALLAAPAAAAVSWDPVDHPFVTGKTQVFDGVDAVGTDDVWAVGTVSGDVGGAFEFRTLAQHWDGTAWTRFPTPDVETAPALDFLVDVSVAGPNHVWAIGSSATAVGNLSSKPLLIHWDGSDWSIARFPTTPSATYTDAIAARAGTLWVLGATYNSQSGYYRPFIARRQASAGWVEVPLPATAGCNATPDGNFARFDTGGIAIGAGGDVFVSGSCGSPAGERAVLARYRDGAWRRVFDPTGLATPTTLADVDANPGGAVRAVGSQPGGPLIVTGSGATEPAPNLGTGIILHSVAAAGHFTAVGVYSDGDPFARPAVLRRSGGQWHTETVSTAYGNPFAVTVDPAGEEWAVGAAVTDDRGLILRRNASR